MSSNDRRAVARRRAWGRGPMILRLESLEGRRLLAAAATDLPDLVSVALSANPAADWGDMIEVKGSIANGGMAPVPPGAVAAIYASGTNVIGPGSVLLATIPITAGLKPGSAMAFDQTVSMPVSPISGMDNNSTKLWIGTRIDPTNAIPEQNEFNNEGVGPGVDQAVVTITPLRPSNLVGTSFGVSASSTTWGSTLSVTGQVTNNAQGDAPATRARIVLTPNGLVPGGANDVTVGSIDVPAIPAFGAVNVVRQISLPAIPPALLAGQGAYLISMIQDADHAASPIIQSPVIQGIGLDTQVITIGPGANSDVKAGAKPDLAATGVVPNSTTLYWGQTFQVSTTVQNLGIADVPKFTVRFALTSVDGTTTNPIYLGSAVVDGLKGQYAQDIVQTLKIPNRLPFGYNVGSIDYGRIQVTIDPENTVDESLKTNNDATSTPIVFKLLSADGKSTVPTLPPIRTNVPAPVVVTTTTTTATTPATTTTPVKIAGTRQAAIQAAANRKAVQAEAAAARKATRLALLSQMAAKNRAHPVKTENPVLHQINKYTNGVGQIIKKFV